MIPNRHQPAALSCARRHSQERTLACKQREPKGRS